MGKGPPYWTFYNYLDQRGKNLMEVWLDAQPLKARRRINDLVGLLRYSEEPAQKHMKDLTRELTGLIELRVGCDGVNYRPLGFKGPGPGEVTLLLGAFHEKSGFAPKDVELLALKLKQEVENDHARICLREHDVHR